MPESIIMPFLFKDTVLAIQALSSVAHLLGDRNQDLSLMFTHSAVDTYRQTLRLIEENEDIYFTFSVCICFTSDSFWL